MTLSNRVALVVSTICAMVYVLSVPGTWLVVTRMVILAVGLFFVLAYMSDSRSKPFATLTAILIGGSSLALILQGFTNFVALSRTAEPWLVVYVFAQTSVLVRNRGNIARMFNT